MKWVKKVVQQCGAPICTNQCCVVSLVFSDVMASYEMASRSSLLFEPPNVTTCAQAAHFIDSKTHRSCQAFQHMIEAPGLCVTKYNPFCTHYNPFTSIAIHHSSMNKSSMVRYHPCKCCSTHTKSLKSYLWMIFVRITSIHPFVVFTIHGNPLIIN